MLIRFGEKVVAFIPFGMLYKLLARNKKVR